MISNVGAPRRYAASASGGPSSPRSPIPGQTATDQPSHCVPFEDQPGRWLPVGIEAVADEIANRRKGKVSGVGLTLTNAWRELRAEGIGNRVHAERIDRSLGLLRGIELA